MINKMSLRSDIDGTVIDVSMDNTSGVTELNMSVEQTSALGKPKTTLRFTNGDEVAEFVRLLDKIQNEVDIL